MKYIFPFILLICFIGPIHSQEGNWCGFDPILEEEMQSNPHFLEEIAHKIEQIRLQAAQNPSSKSAIYTIPVVFHIIHDGGAGNISMEQIQSGLDVMNEDFAALNLDAGQIRNTSDAPFAPIHADVQVEFKLAKIDPDGNCTNGVQRKFAPQLTNNAGEDCKYSANGGLDAWPNDSYLNIWVVNSIGGSGTGTTLGYAYLPYNNWGPGHGILNRHDRIGRIGTAANNGGRTLTHEMGHICGLFHTFQDGCHSSDCNFSGDYICDTPPVAEAIWGCLPSNNSCNDVPVNDFYGLDALDMNENHMSYNSCRLMFSEGQKALMQNNFETISNFVSLTSSANLIATGVNAPEVLCKADFDANKTVICLGETVDFSDLSYHGITSRSWTFQGGTPATSNLQNPSVIYNTPGVFEVSLTVSDGNNSATETKSFFIHVLGNSVPLPFYESFESVTSLPDLFWVTNNFGSDNAFEIGNVGLSGSKSAALMNFDQPIGGMDEIISSPIDLSGVSGQMTLSFRYAYRKRQAANEEWLRVFISNNCGENWAQRKTLKGDLLGEIIATDPWFPGNDNEWVTVHMTNVTSAYWVNDFRVKFQFENDGGNNFFLDNINIYEGAPSNDIVLSAGELNPLEQLSIYPNPADQTIHVSFSASEQKEVIVSIFSADGREVLAQKVLAQSGKNLVLLDVSALSEGVYVINMQGGKGSQTIRKIVIH
ncbi:MAG: M43 family zinc metalloprotease [Brumimicrobium sp.]|nr:M43 family zinc metalloprotease [Brumimicrobium sp.]